MHECIRFFYRDRGGDHEESSGGHGPDLITDLIEALYVPAIQAGMNASEFWNSSIAEIEYRIAEYRRVRDENLKQEIIHMFIQAELFAERHPKIPFVKYPSNQKLTMPWDISPTLFADEKEEADEAQKQEEFEQFKERRRRFYALYNKMRGGECSE